MGRWFSDDSDQAQAYNDYQNEPHKAKLSHELIAAAASYEAAKAYEDHVAKNGQPDSHAKAKEIFAGFAGAFVDREVEKHKFSFGGNQKDTLTQGAYGHVEDYIGSDYN